MNIPSESVLLMVNPCSFSLYFIFIPYIHTLFSFICAKFRIRQKSGFYLPILDDLSTMHRLFFDLANDDICGQR